MNSFLIVLSVILQLVSVYEKFRGDITAAIYTLLMAIFILFISRII
jgi:hypothetical protein